MANNPTERIPGNRESRPLWYDRRPSHGRGQAPSRAELAKAEEEPEPIEQEPETSSEAPESGGGSSWRTKVSSPQNPTGKNPSGKGDAPFELPSKKDTRRWAYRHRKKILGGGLTGSIAALLVFFTSIGPLQLVHLSETLKKDFANQENASNGRFSQGLYRWYRSRDIGETRLGWVGSKIFRSVEADMQKIGVTFEKSSLLGQMTAVRIDANKHPDYKGKTISQQRAAIAEANGVSTSEVRRLPRSREYRINIRNIDITAKRNVIKTTVGGANGKILTAIKFRSVAKFYNLPSWLHPLKRIAATADNKLENAIERSNWRKERNARLEARTPEAKARAASIRRTLGISGAVTGGALLGAGGVCIAKDIAHDVPEINRANVVIPSMASAGDAIALGEQIKSGKDFNLAQVDAVNRGLVDKNGQTIWDATALRAKNEKSGGEDIDPGLKQAYATNSSAANFEKTIDDNFPGVCSQAGRIAQAAGGVALLFLPGPGWIAKGLSTAVGAAAITFISTVLPKALSEEPVQQNLHEGPSGGNFDAYGSRALANAAYTPSGAVELSNTETAVLEKQNIAIENEEFQSKPLADRMFDVYDPKSVASQVIDNVNSSPKYALIQTATGLLNFRSQMGNITALFSNKAQAEFSYDWGFPRYGFSARDLSDPDLEDPYENADIVVPLLDGPNGNDYISKAKKCFGTDIKKGSHGWEAVAAKDVNPTTGEYQGLNCGSRDMNWIRIRMFIFDSRLMDSYACFEGEEGLAEDSCKNTGSNLTNPATAPAENPTTVPAETIDMDELGKSSDDLTCAPDTKDLGVVQSLYSGAVKKESGPMKIRLCQIKSIPGMGNNTRGVQISGGAVVEARVSAAWSALGKAAKADGITLSAGSSFRLAHSCGGTGDGTACARPGQSPHQTGWAIDFGNGMYPHKGTSTSSCSGRARLPNNKAWKWLHDNADRFGIKQYSYEAWHWDPMPMTNRCGKDQ